MAFHKFLKASSSGGEIEVYGTGNRRGTSLHRGRRQCELPPHSSGVGGESYNTGGGSRIKLIECIRIIEEISGRRPILRFGDYRGGRPAHARRRHEG
jgi:hypothetical protein